MTFIDQENQKNSPTSNFITIVSGLPRSGTSMMMNILTAGGMEVLVDNVRHPDYDNPKGYFEYERVKNLPEGDTSWLSDASGKVVKIVAFFIPYLPDNYEFKIVFMHRPMSEILASQMAMLSNRGDLSKEVNNDYLISIYEKHIKQVNDWVKKSGNVQLIDIYHNELIFNPLPQINRISEFINHGLNIDNMKKAIDPNLYRQRKD